MAQRLFVHLVCREGRAVWKSNIRSEMVKRVLFSWPNHNAGITRYPHFHGLRIDQFQSTRKFLPITHAVLIDPNQHAIKHWIKVTAMPAIHVSKLYNANSSSSLPFEGIGRVNVSEVYRKNDTASSNHHHVPVTYSDYDPTIKPPLVVPVYGIRSLHFLHHVLDDLIFRLQCAATEPKDVREDDGIITCSIDELKFKADKL